MAKIGTSLRSIDWRKVNAMKIAMIGVKIFGLIIFIDMLNLVYLWIMPISYDSLIGSWIWPVIASIIVSDYATNSKKINYLLFGGVGFIVYFGGNALLYLHRTIQDFIIILYFNNVVNNIFILLITFDIILLSLVGLISYFYKIDNR